MSRVPWLALGAVLVGAGLRLAAFLQPAAGLLPGCVFKRVTGLACATCGITRCVLALGAGDWRGAFHWHPATALLAGLLPVLALWDLRRAWRGDPYPALPQAPWVRWSAWGLLGIVWLVQVLRGI